MIATASDCLTDEQIGDLAAGRLPAERFTRLLAHLESCAECRGRAEQADPSGDSIVRALGNPAPPDPHAAEPDCLALLRGGDRLGGMESAVISPPIDQLGPYQLIRPLGSGGMGAVFLANHDRLRRRCAVKVLPRERCHDAAWKERFDREMAAVAALADPHVVAATDAGEVDGWSYLVMEYLDGLDLSRLAMRMGTLEVADACELMRQAAIGLSHIHAAALVHRDIKPSNLMLTRDGVVKILDLGLVLSGTDPLPADDRLTTVGQLIGTVAYMAPEQLVDCSSVDQRADLYALGATLYRLLAGTPPYGSTRGIAPLIVAKTGRDAPLLAEHRRDVPDAVNDLVRRLLERDPAARPDSADDVARALQPFVADARLDRLVAAAIRKGPALEESSAPLPTLVRHALPPEPPRRRPSRFLIAAASLPLLLLAGVVITLVTDQGQLVIESESEGIVVSVLRDDQEVRRMELETGDNRIRLRSGNYTVSVEGQADGISLSKDSATVTRGGQTVLSVRRVARPAVAQASSGIPRADGESVDATTHDNAPHGAYGEVSYVDVSNADGAYGDGQLRRRNPGSVEPMFGGESLSRWLTILESDRDIEKIVEAMRAVAEIGGFELADDPTAVVEDSQRRRAAAAMLRLARRYGGYSLGSDRFPSHRFMEGLLTCYPALLPSPGLELLAEELQYGSEKSSIAVIWLLHEYLMRPEERTGRLYEPDPDGLQRWSENAAGRRRLEQLAQRIDRFVDTQGGFVVEVESTAQDQAETGPTVAVSTHPVVHMAYPVRLSIDRILERNSLDDPAIGLRLRTVMTTAEAFCRDALKPELPEDAKTRRSRLSPVVLTEQEIEEVLKYGPADSLAWFLAPSLYQQSGKLSQQRRLELQRHLAKRDPAGTADAVLAVLRHIASRSDRALSGLGDAYYGGTEMDMGMEMGAGGYGGMHTKTMTTPALDFLMEMGAGGYGGMHDDGLLYGLFSNGGEGAAMYGFMGPDGGGMGGMAGGMGMGGGKTYYALLEHALPLIAESTTRSRLALEVLSRFSHDKTNAAREKLQARLSADADNR